MFSAKIAMGTSWTIPKEGDFFPLSLAGNFGSNFDVLVISFCCDYNLEFEVAFNMNAQLFQAYKFG